MIKKSLFIIILVTLASCSTVKDKTSGIKEMGSIGKECPPKNERTLKKGEKLLKITEKETHFIDMLNKQKKSLSKNITISIRYNWTPYCWHFNS